MTPADPLEDGRTAFGAGSWNEAFGFLSAADTAAPLEPADLELLAGAAYLTGRHDACTDAWTRAYQLFAGRAERERAAGCAFWLAFTLVNRGEMPPAAGWLSRGVELLDEVGDCVQRGYLQGLAGVTALMQGDVDGALAKLESAQKIAAEFVDADLQVLSRLGHAQTLLALGRTDEGVAQLDVVMVAVTSGEASAAVTGLAYCAVISACQYRYDVGRAAQWTAALTHWCDAQPGLVPYTGQCLVHRAEIMRLRGAWPDALEAARAAYERFELAADRVSAGAAYHLTAELDRLRGDFGSAEEGYREASRRGHDPQPGLALLRLAQGRRDVAAATIGRVADETQDLRRPLVLAAQVEILLAAGDVPGARTACDELDELATAHGAPLLLATAAQCSGAVLLADGDVRGGLLGSRRAWSGWQRLGAPYEAARCRVLVGLGCRALGDEDSALMELDAARWAFTELGAAPDLARVDGLSRAGGAAPCHGLTARELEVLRLVATGAGNRAIAAELVLSEKTVARHLANIFAKLDLPSRAAATAFAYEHRLL